MSGAEKLQLRYPLAKQIVEDGTASPQLRRAVELLLAGKVQREIAAELGLSISKVGDLLADPTGERARERKGRNHGLCLDCGAKTFNSGSRIWPERCATCAPRHRRKFSRQRIIEAIHDWHARYGKPPAAMDWDLSMAAARAHPGRLALIEEAHRVRDWPCVSTVASVFGSWNAAITVAGLQPSRQGQRIDPDSHAKHLKGERKMLSPVDVIDREIDKNEGRKKTLAEKIAQLDKNVEQLKQAKASLAKD